MKHTTSKTRLRSASLLLLACSPLASCFSAVPSSVTSSSSSFSIPLFSLRNINRNHYGDFVATTSSSPSSSSLPISLRHRHHRDLLILNLSSSNDDQVDNIANDNSTNNDDWQNRLNEWTAPIQGLLDGASSGWALSYADLQPDTPRTPAGIMFLATNLSYGIAGLLLILQQQSSTDGSIGLFGLLTDVTALVSFQYHYQQLEADGDGQAPAVRLALLTDYVFASAAMLTATYYLWDCYYTASYAAVPIEGAAFAAASLVFLGLCWVYEEGRAYMVLHGIWHLLSGYAGYLIGMAHSNL